MRVLTASAGDESSETVETGGSRFVVCCESNVDSAPMTASGAKRPFAENFRLYRDEVHRANPTRVNQRGGRVQCKAQAMLRQAMA
jgi:hypothetical protein